MPIEILAPVVRPFGSLIALVTDDGGRGVDWGSVNGVEEVDVGVTGCGTAETRLPVKITELWHLDPKHM